MLEISDNNPELYGGSSPLFFSIGRAREEFGEFFWGRIDELRFYDTALTPSEISSLAAVPEPNTLLLVGGALCGLAWARRQK